MIDTGKSGGHRIILDDDDSAYALALYADRDDAELIREYYSIMATIVALKYRRIMFTLTDEQRLPIIRNKEWLLGVMAGELLRRGIDVSRAE